MNQWDQFLTPYKQAVDELKVKLKGLRKQYEVGENTSPIEFVTGRVKPISSIIDKANKKRYSVWPLTWRNVWHCWVKNDVSIRRWYWCGSGHTKTAKRDFKVIEERDYIRNTKESGYRSYHVIIEYPIETLNGQNIS